MSSQPLGLEREVAFGPGDRNVRSATSVGLTVLGLAIAVAVVIQLLDRRLSAPEDVPRALALPALYATAALIAILAARQRRPLILAAAGALCLAGSALSIAMIVFAIPGILLIVVAARLWRSTGAVAWLEVGVAILVVALVMGAAAALLGTTEGRCWRATGSLASPSVEVVACPPASASFGDGEEIASGYDSAVLTARGALMEGGLLLLAIALVWLTGRANPLASRDSNGRASEPA